MRVGVDRPLFRACRQLSVTRASTERSGDGAAAGGVRSTERSEPTRFSEGGGGQQADRHAEGVGRSPERVSASQSLQARQFPPRGANRSGSRLLNGLMVVQIHPWRLLKEGEPARSGHPFEAGRATATSLGIKTSALFAVPPEGARTAPPPPSLSFGAAPSSRCRAPSAIGP